MKNIKKSKFTFVLVVILCVVVVVSLAALIFNFSDNTRKINSFVKRRTDISTVDQTDNDKENITQSVTEDLKPTETIQNPIDFKKLHEINGDVYSWICIPNTNIDYPVAQSSEQDDFYLSHDVYKEYLFSGTIYSEKINKMDYSDPVTVLYGHNMLNGSMFANLHYFADKDFFDKNRYIYIYTVDKAYVYEIYSVFEYDNRHIMYAFDFAVKSSFQEFIDYSLSPQSTYSNVRDNINVTTDDKLLVLSTCGNDERDVRFLVVGKLVSVQNSQ